MSAPNIVALLAVLQYLFFVILTGRARTRYGVKAPAVTGHPMFERALRVQINTLEQMVAFLPCLLIAGQYAAPALVAGIGAVYLVGRLLYWRGYMADPKKRLLGFGLTIMPIFVLLGMGIYGALRQL